MAFLALLLEIVLFEDVQIPFWWSESCDNTTERVPTNSPKLDLVLRALQAQLLDSIPMGLEKTSSQATKMAFLALLLDIALLEDVQMLCGGRRAALTPQSTYQPITQTRLRSESASGAVA